MSEKKREYSRKMYYSIMARVCELSADQKDDLIAEVVGELSNPRWSNNDERLEGMLEAMEMVLGMDIIN